MTTDQINTTLDFYDVVNFHKIIDLTTSRVEAGRVNAEIYCKQFNKKLTRRVLDYFERDCADFHKVRDLIEKIPGNDFQKVLNIYRELHKATHSDWRSALETGLLYKAQETEGHYTDTPYIYSDPIAVQIREEGINKFNFETV